MVRRRTQRKWPNSGAGPTWLTSATRTCGHPPARTWTQWTLRSGPSWRRMSAQRPTAAPPIWSGPFRPPGPTLMKVPCGARASQQSCVSRLWWRQREVISSGATVVWISTCSWISVQKNQLNIFANNRNIWKNRSVNLSAPPCILSCGNCCRSSSMWL